MGFTVQHVAAGDDEVIGVVGEVPPQQVVFLNFPPENMDEGWLSPKSFSMAVRMVLWDRDGEVADGQPLACFSKNSLLIRKGFCGILWTGSGLPS